MAKIFIAPASRVGDVLRLQKRYSDIKKTEGQVVMYRQRARGAEERLRKYRAEAAELGVGLEEYHVT
jgi:hypothetical protein